MIRAARDRLGRQVRRLAKSLADGRLKRFQGSRVRVVRSGYISTLDDPVGIFRLDAPTFARTLGGEHVTNWRQAVRRNADTVVGAHIRKGHDYATFRHGRHYLTPGQLLPLLRGLQAQLAPQTVAFLICFSEAQRPEDFIGFNLHYMMADHNLQPDLDEPVVNCG